MMMSWRKVLVIWLYRWLILTPHRFVGFCSVCWWSTQGSWNNAIVRLKIGTKQNGTERVSSSSHLLSRHGMHRIQNTRFSLIEMITTAIIVFCHIVTPLQIRKRWILLLWREWAVKCQWYCWIYWNGLAQIDRTRKCATTRKTINRSRASCSDEHL